MADSFYVNKTQLNIAEYDEADRLAISIRPEVVHLSEEPVEGKNVYQGEVSLVQFTGESVDRKSTRLNSSHVAISYAVFCLKKKQRAQNQLYRQQHTRLVL